MADKSINKLYTLEAAVLTPLHIGAGTEKDWLENADFIFENGKVYLLDQKKIINAIGVDKLASSLSSGNLKNSLPGDIDRYASNIYDCKTLSRNEIKAHVRAGLDNKPVIPGSSLKGALRSIIINSFHPKGKHDINNMMGAATKGDEFGRFIKLSDAHFSNTELTNTKIFNLSGSGTPFTGGWKHAPKNATDTKFKPKGFNTIYEIIPKGERADLSLKIADGTWNNFKKHAEITYKRQNKLEKKEKIIENDIEYLFSIINDYTKIYIDKEIAFFTKYNQAEHTDKIIDSLKNIKSHIAEDNKSCVMRMAAGSGFHGITGDWQHELHDVDRVTNYGRGPSKSEFNGKKSAKSRKIAINNNRFEPMGFIKLSLISERDLQKRAEKEKQKLLEEKKQQEILRQKEKEEKERKQHFNNLLGEAENHINKNQFEEANKKIEEAENIDTGNERLNKLKDEASEKKKAYDEEIAKIQRQKELEKIEKQKEEEIKERQKNNIEEEQNKKKELETKGLKLLLADVSEYEDGKTIINKYTSYVNLTDADKDEIKSFINRCINNLTSKKKIKKWSKFNKNPWNFIYNNWIDKTEAKQIYDEFMKAQ